MHPQIEHRYGPRVRLLDSPYLQTILAKLCSPQSRQPELNQLVYSLYTQMLSVIIDEEFPRKPVSTPTRMHNQHKEAILNFEAISSEQRAAVVNIARAGTWPAHLCYEFLHQVIDPDHLRQDHVYAARQSTPEGKVTGTKISYAKIGGDIQDSIVLVPDPMGATGSTLIAILDHYKKSIPGKARKFIAMHLIVTPEYLKKVLTHHDDLIVYSLRLDRGLSSEAVLKSPLGQFWDQEKGLNENGYIVPGGGGFGEVMNNSFV